MIIITDVILLTIVQRLPKKIGRIFYERHVKKEKIAPTVRRSIVKYLYGKKIK